MVPVKRNELTLAQLAIIWVMYIHDTAHPEHARITLKRAMRDAHVWAVNSGFPALVLPASENKRIREMLTNQLGALGLIRKEKERWNLNHDRAAALFSVLGSDWRTWPVSIPIQGETLRFDQAVYPN